MKKAKYSEVPKEYRKDYKKIAVEFLKMFAICFIIVVIFYWMIIVFA